MSKLNEMSDEFLTIAISSRALFDLGESNHIFEQEGLESYRRFQIDRERETLLPGEAFGFVEKLLNLNRLLGRRRVEVVLLSRNSADTGLRIFNSIKAHGLDITRAAFSGGSSPYRYARAFGCSLFLSSHLQDVSEALENGLASALLVGGGALRIDNEDLRIAFDGDAVLFSDEAEKVFAERGLEAFVSQEEKSADEPLAGGPFRHFLEGLEKLQREFSDVRCPIRTALVTARSAPAHERVIKTLRDWNVRLDESLFLGGRDKTEFLRAFVAYFFFDDQAINCERASAHVAAGHVTHGVKNK